MKIEFFTLFLKYFHYFVRKLALFQHLILHLHQFLDLSKNSSLFLNFYSMSKFSYVFNAHPAYIESIYKQYLQDPASVEEGWRVFLKDLTLV